MLMAETPILQDTERVSGRVALKKNIDAGVALAGAVRSTLGPKGLDKMLIDQSGRILVTNDGITVLENAKVEHPIAKMMINASATQDRVARDGTTSTVLIAAELLQNSWQLVLQGVHPTIISKGYRKAEAIAAAEIDKIGTTANDDQILNTIQTALDGKISVNSKSHLASLALKAARQIAYNNQNGIKVDLSKVTKLPRVGGKNLDSEVVNGIVMNKKPIHADMPMKLSNGKILILAGGIERRKLRQLSTLQISSKSGYTDFVNYEYEQLKKKVEHIVNLGINVLAVKDNIDDNVHKMLAENGIQCFRRVPKEDLELISDSCNANMVLSVENAGVEDLGDFISSTCSLVGGVNQWTLEGSGKVATFIVKGSTETSVAEYERCFDDALGVAAAMIRDPQILAGGGASQTYLARKLRRAAIEFPKREQLAVEAYADALEIIPRVLAENAGLDPIDTLFKLVASQTENESTSRDMFFGLEVHSKSPKDMLKAGFVEPIGVVRQSINSATESAVSVLRIDDVLWAKVEPEVPDEAQERLNDLGMA